MRVHVGVRSLEKTPTYVEVFGRIIPMRLNRYRWFDIPFTRSESLTADKKITMTCRLNILYYFDVFYYLNFLYYFDVFNAEIACL